MIDVAMHTVLKYGNIFVPVSTPYFWRRYTGENTIEPAPESIINTKNIPNKSMVGAKYINTVAIVYSVRHNFIP